MIRKVQTRASAEELFRDAEQKEERGDFSGAFQSLLVSAKLGNVLSQLNLGNFYATARGVKKNLQEAARWYKKVYRNGVPSGALNHSVDLQKQGNERGAITWLKRAAAMDHGDACVRLAKIYLKKRNGIKTAADFLRKAVSLSRSNISDDTKKQAEALLKRIGKDSM
jgi:TPR repeat protein